MERQVLTRCLEKNAGGAQFITKRQLCEVVGFSESTARRTLKGVKAINRRYYFIPEVVDKLLEK